MRTHWTRTAAVAMFLAAGCAGTAGAPEVEAGGGAAMAAPAPAVAGSPHDRPGFTTRESNGRIWVFREGSKEVGEFDAKGEPTIAVSRIGAGPGGATLRAADTETLDLYQAAKPGWGVRLSNGRIWVFRIDDPALLEFDAKGEPTVAASRIGAGPGGRTLRAPDIETLDAWEAAR